MVRSFTLFDGTLWLGRKLGTASAGILNLCSPIPATLVLPVNKAGAVVNVSPLPGNTVAFDDKAAPGGGHCEL